MKNLALALLLAGMLAGCNSLEHDRLATQRDQAESAAQIAGSQSAAQIAASNATRAQANANVDMYQTLADAAGQTGRILGAVLFGLLVIAGIVLWFAGKFYLFQAQTAAQERQIKLITARDRAAADLYLEQALAQLAPVATPAPALGDGPLVPPAVAARARQTPGAVPIWHPDHGWLIVDRASGKVRLVCRKVIA